MDLTIIFLNSQATSYDSAAVKQQIKFSLANQLNTLHRPMVEDLDSGNIDET